MDTTFSPHALVDAQSPRSVFERVLCGVDDTPAGFAAATVAARVCAPKGSLALLSVEDPSIAIHAGWATPFVLEEIDGAARHALEQGNAAAELHHPTEGRVASGHPVDALKAALNRDHSTLVVVGRHDRSRAARILLSSVATDLLHDAPCSVIVVPAHGELDRWPRSIVVGVDGSEFARAALQAARALSARFDVHIRAIMATAGGQLNVERALAMAPELEKQPLRAVDSLVIASEETDLVVVGSLGLSGLRTLGSVSERVAHEAHAPVLVVRT